MSSYVAVDVGAESGRVVVGEIRRNRIECQEVHTFPTGAVRLPDGLYWDVLRIFEEIKSGLKAAQQAHGRRLTSVSVDTWGIDFALLDRDGALVANPHCYRDQRAAGMMEEVIGLCGKWEVFEQSGGIQFLPMNTLYQLYSMVRHESPLLAAADTLLMMPDLFHYWLTGEKAVEYTNATTTQFYDATRGAWSSALLERLGIGTRLLPEVISSGTVLGDLRRGIAGEVGLAGVKVIAGATHDTAAAAVAIPFEDDGCWISSGTWSLVGSYSERPFVSKEAMSWNISSYGGFGGTFVPWRNVMGLWLIQECRRAWSRHGEVLPYGAIAEMAEAAPAFVAVIDPDNAAFLAPDNMPAAIQKYCQDTGQRVPESNAEIARTALEGLALRYRWTINGLGSLRGRGFTAVHVVGGGSRNATLCQFTADATGLPVVAGPVEATAMGNVAIQAVSMGAVDGIARIRELVRGSVQTTRYEPNGGAGWDEPYDRFLRLVEVGSAAHS